MEIEIREQLIDILDSLNFDDIYFCDEILIKERIKNNLSQTRFNLKVEDVQIQRISEFEFQFFLKTNLRNFIFNINLDEL